ncbi:AMP-binding protein [Paraburkholderia fungorum]|uniref:AMP-binding protein n=1 Tax=Paraburkholderia fungorum TaxID=134537 RepID=UPI0038B905E4
MEFNASPCDPNKRVSELVNQYADPAVSVAWLLCDRHDPQSVAYEIVDAKLQTTRMTYGELRRQSEAFAAGLAALGVKQGDRVATLAGKSQEFLVALIGIWRLGAVHVPLFTAFAAPAIALRLTGSGAKVVICDLAQLPKLASIEDMPENPAWRVVVIGGAEGDISHPYDATFRSVLTTEAAAVNAAALGGDAPFIHIYTSGTTGRPKGVVVPTCRDGVRSALISIVFTVFNAQITPRERRQCFATSRSSVRPLACSSRWTNISSQAPGSIVGCLCKT